MTDYSFNRIYKTAAVLTFLVFSAGLLSYVLIGTTSRYLQDDYCYSVFLTGENFFLEQYNSYMYEMAYSANRFSLTLGMGLSGLAGPGIVSVLPGMMLSIWMIGLYSLIRRISSLNPRISLDRLEAFLLSAALAVFTLSLAPSWIQIFFWRPGMFPYFAPIVTGTYLVLWMVIAGQAARGRPWWLLGVFFLALLTGGFSETAVSVEVVFLAVVFGAALISKSARRRWLLPAGTALLGAAAAMALLIASPMNGARLARAYGAASSLQSAVLQSLDGGIYFYLFTAYRPTLLYASALIFFGLFGFIHSSRSQKPALSWKLYAAGLLSAILIAYLLTTAAMAPSFYAESSYPGKRALIIPCFVSVLLAAAAGLLTGNFLSRWRKARWFSAALVFAGVGMVAVNALWLSGMTEHFIPPAYPDMRAFLKQHAAPAAALAALSALVFGLVVHKYQTRGALALIVLIYLVQPGLMAARILHEYPILQQRAALWDARQAQIIAARDNGENELTVRALDSLAGLTDLSDNPAYWVNNCAANYYGVRSIRAVEPVLDTKRLINP